MSQPVHETISMAPTPGVEIRTGHPPQSGKNDPLQGVSELADGSGPLFSMYLKLAEEEDEKMTENWKGDADGILIFTGLFSATVAAFVAVSVQDLKPSSQDISAFYLANIFQVLADSNGSQFLIPPTLPNPSIPFSPPTSAVWVNSLWFLSLLISLTCALLATLLQQWARRYYMKVTQTRYSPHKRARIRAFFAEGVEKLHLPWAVEALPALLHLSLFLFFAGLAVFLFNINHTVFKVAISWIGLCAGMYICITLMPMFRHDSPYYAPLSSSAWYLYAGTLCAMFGIILQVVKRIAVRLNATGGTTIFDRMFKSSIHYMKRASQGMEKGSEETALNAPSGINDRALIWTYESLDEDHELEQFFAGIPGFCSSEVVDNPQSSLKSLRNETVAWALNKFLERTWSSNLVPETIKIRRLVTCVRAIDAAHLYHAVDEILEKFFTNRLALFQSVELGHSLIGWGNNDDRNTGFFSQVIIPCIISNVPQRNERWFALTTRHLGISEHVLRSYLDHGNSLSLAILIHSTRHFVHIISWKTRYLLAQFECGRVPLDFDVQNTLPGLQHDFCDLWNEIVLQRRSRGDYILSIILEKLRTIYDALHQGSTLDDDYQLCSTPAHRIGSTSTLIKVDGDRSETALAPITTPPLYHHDPVPSVIPLVTKCDTPLSLTSNLDHTIPHLVDERSRNGVVDIITPAASSFGLALLDNDRISDDTAADSIQGTTVPFAISDPAATHISADPTVSQSGRSPEDGSKSHPPSQIFIPFPLTSQVTSSLDSNAATEIGPLDAPDRTLIPNPRIMPQSFTPSSPDVTEYSLRSKDGDLSETSGLADIRWEMTEMVTTYHDLEQGSIG